MLTDCFYFLYVNSDGDFTDLAQHLQSTWQTTQGVERI